ncbi:MAG: endopeptidase La [Clostridia bacterium]|nr:endopeptidase La [Clostridia bacterium]
MEFKTLPVLPLRGVVMFPHLIAHFDVGRDGSVAAITKAVKKDDCIFVTSQKEPMDEVATVDNLFEVGTVAMVRQVLKIGDRGYRVVLEGMYRAHAVEYKNEENYISGETVRIYEFPCNKEEIATMATFRLLRNGYGDFFDRAKKIAIEPYADVTLCEEPDVLTDIVAGQLLVDINERQELLSEPSVDKRMARLVEILDREKQLQELDMDISEKVHKELDLRQKEYFLNEKIRMIRDELGDNQDVDDELENFAAAIEKIGLLPEHEEKLMREVDKLARFSPQSPEAGVIHSYLTTVLDLPWNIRSEERVDIKLAEEILERDHYGLKKVKERILEFFAVRKLGGDPKGSILCLVGPPGVGKTSIVKSVAEALNRKYVRVSLGGVRDEAEIRGHRKTYIGSMPGRIMAAVTQAKTVNPLILLDEIDKLSNDYKGDPSSALLEVLDREQNFEFTDHYIDIPFDLSDVLFITTANDAGAIPSALRDRMELIEIPGYTYDEKLQIAMRHIIPKQMKNYNIKKVEITEDAVKKLILEYTREAGVRTMERVIEKLLRKSAKLLVEGKRSVKITERTLQKYLGIPKFLQETLDKEDQIGVVTGLAWTSVGGETLNVEVNVMEGNGKLELTGSLGDVMQESAKAAYSYIRANAEALGVPAAFYKKTDIHIHVPEGAVPKDGPSAGVTMTTALVSALSGKRVRHDVAMTGEVTLRGRVLPIGGLKEKSLAALQHGAKTVVIPKENKKDLEEVPDVVKENIKFILADKVETVLDTALLKTADEDYKNHINGMVNRKPEMPLGERA